MAIGTAAAIGLGVAGVGSFLGGKSANKAASKAAKVSSDNNAQNVALQREVYNQNKALLNPFVQRGNAAGDTINALLGLGVAQQPPASPTNNNALTVPYSGAQADSTGRPLPRTYFDYRANLAGYGPVGGATTNTTSAQNGNTGIVPPTGGISPQQAASNAFDIFRNSTGYQFRLGEGYNALNSGYAGAGILQSGDAMRAATEYGQNFASNEFGNYLGYLGNQQGVGLSAGSAVAGVGQNYANNVTAENTANAANQANALLSKTNPFANTLGMIGGGLLNYGMR